MGGLLVLPGVGLPLPLFEVFRMEVSVSARPVGVQATYRCLLLHLWYDLVIHLDQFRVCFQCQTRVVCLLPLVEGL